MTALLEVSGLTIRRNGRPVVEDVSFTLEAGGSVGVLGESGAGKSLTLKALAGLLPAGFSAEGSVKFDGVELIGLARRRLREIRGPGILFMTQQAMSAFDPRAAVGGQLVQTLLAHRDLPKGEARGIVISALERLGFTDPAALFARRPAELSGGMLQRAMTAAAMILEPQLLLADEPTSALDVLSRRQVENELLELTAANASALVLVTHDLSAARRLAEKTLVMRRGRVVEAGPATILDHPQTPYVAELLAAKTRLDRVFTTALEAGGGASAARRGRTDENAPELVAVEGVERAYGGGRERRTVLSDLSFTIRRGEVLGLVGGSGEGKSTAARILLGLERPDAGRVELAHAPLAEWRRRHPGGMCAVFQNYAASIDPLWSAGRAVLETTPQTGVERARELLARVGLGPEMLERLPHELSGGELQRVACARALASSPDFVVFDEALSSLDASVQSDMLELLASLRSPDAAWLFITHDLRAAARLCSRIAVLSGGRIVEVLDAGRLDLARSPAARRLIDAARAEL